MNGKDHLLGTHGSAASKAEYNRLTSEWLANGKQLPTGANDLTVAELVKAFWTHALKDYGPGSRKGAGEAENFRPALRRLRKMYGNTLIADFRPLSLKALRESMTKPYADTDPKTKLEVTRPGWSRTHTNRQVKRICQVFRWGVEHELVPPAVSQALLAVAPLKAGRSDARETDPVRPVPEQHVDAVLPLVSRQVAAMVNLQRLTGMRPGEVCDMRGLDIDTSGKLWLYKPQKHKTQHLDHERFIYLGKRA